MELAHFALLSDHVFYGPTAFLLFMSLLTILVVRSYLKQQISLGRCIGYIIGLFIFCVGVMTVFLMWLTALR